MALSDRPAERHRQVGQLFTDRVRGTRLWAGPAPGAGLGGRDIVPHLAQWLPGFPSAGAAIELPSGASVDDDPVAAWQIHCAAVQALLDDPATADRVLANPHTGALPLDRAVDQFYTADVFMHTWDLARATGQDDRLDAGLCSELLAGMDQIEEAMRSSGQFGPRVGVPADAGPQVRMLGFIGRDPFWYPPRPAG